MGCLHLWIYWFRGILGEESGPVPSRAALWGERHAPKDRRANKNGRPRGLVNPNFVEEGRRANALRPESKRRLNSIGFRKGAWRWPKKRACCRRRPDSPRGGRS